MTMSTTQLDEGSIIGNNGTSAPPPSVQGPIEVFIVQWIICLFGLVGNFFVLCIYGRKVPKAPSERFIIAIALTDFAMNFCFILFTVKMRWWPPDDYALYFCLISNSFYDVINTSSSILVCWMTLNRYVAVCKPHSYNTYFTMNKVNWMLASTFALSAASCSLSFSICFCHFPPPDWNIKPSDGFDVIKFVWVNVRLLLLLIATLLMAILYRMVAVTMNEKKAKASHKELQPMTCMEDSKAALNRPMSKHHLQQSVKLSPKSDEHRGSRPDITSNSCGAAESTTEKSLDSPKPRGTIGVQLSAPPCTTSTNIGSDAPGGGGTSSLSSFPQCPNGMSPPLNERGQEDVSTSEKSAAPSVGQQLSVSPQSERRRPSFTHQVVGKSSVRENRRRKKSSRASLLDQNLTMTLFAISVAYVVLMIPDVIIQFLDSLNFFEESLFENYRTPAQLLYTINFVTNPVIYFICNNYFKTELRKIFARCFPSCIDINSRPSTTA